MGTVEQVEALAAVAIVVTHDWRLGVPSTRRLLAFGAADMFSGGCGWLDGWVYKPRLDTWRNVTSLQFVLEKMVARESKTE